MNGKTLAPIFSAIPTSVCFPWEAPVGGLGAGPRRILSLDDDDVDSGDMLHELLHGGASMSDEDEGVDTAALEELGVMAGGVGGGVDLRQAERSAAIEKAKAAHDQRIQESIDKTRALVVAAAAATTAPNTREGRGANLKRPRQGAKVDRSDPDVQALDKLVESNAGLSGKWETKRDALTADEQEALLLVPGADGKEVAGSVCLYHPSKGYGFIAPDCGGPDIYFTKEGIVCSHSAQEALAEAGVAPSLGVGERVTFTVSLNDSHSTRRLKAEEVRVEGDGGESALVTALRGRRFMGKVRNFNLDGNRGYIQSVERDALDEIASSGGVFGTVHKCHCKGVIDAMFVLSGAQIGSGLVPTNGMEVEYYLMPTLDLKTGRAVAINCHFLNAVGSSTAMGGSGGATDEGALGQYGADSSEPFAKKSRPEVAAQQISVQSAVSVAGAAPKLLLLDDGDDGSW